ncbi:hypothetical protein ACIQCR_19590 [Streptomyces sp. NPDC093249]|uniref:hypothetical protein n=1 Tax=unclassified Streptomyces TaxID=2593676 RepID=UPI0038181B30
MSVSPNLFPYIYDLGINGVFTLSFSVPGVTPNSVVMVSMCELGGQSRTPFIGDATMTVHNVAPDNGQVHVRGEVDWDSTLSVRMYFLVS